MFLLQKRKDTQAVYTKKVNIVTFTKKKQNKYEWKIIRMPYHYNSAKN